MEYLDRLSQFAAELDFGALPAQVQDQAGWILADTLAAIVGGSAEPELRALAATLDATGPATLPGLGRSASADVAALVNGTAGTFLEMDEGNRFSRGHPAVHVIAAVLALAQQRGTDARSFMSAFVVGYEVASRIGAASQLRASMHPHGTWGTIGAAAGRRIQAHRLNRRLRSKQVVMATPPAPCTEQARRIVTPWRCR